VPFGNRAASLFAIPRLSWSRVSLPWNGCDSRDLSMRVDLVVLPIRRRLWAQRGIRLLFAPLPLLLFDGRRSRLSNCLWRPDPDLGAEEVVLCENGETFDLKKEEVQSPISRRSTQVNQSVSGSSMAEPASSLRKGLARGNIMDNMNQQVVMNAEITGAGDPIVLVPGGLTGWLSWVPFVEPLAQHHSVVRVQLLSVQGGA
jgi:hypothetical protein